VPPILALALCSAFVVFLLRLEHKQSPTVSKALWIPTIWFIYTSSKALGTWFKTGSGDMETGSPTDRVFLIVLLVISLIILSRRKLEWLEAIKENPWPVIIILYMLASVFWSGMPAISFRRWVRELIPVSMALLVLSEKNLRLALESMIRRKIYILIPFSIVLIKYFPEYGRLYSRWTGGVQWVGATYQKNGLALLCIFSIMYLVWKFVNAHNFKASAMSKLEVYADISVLLLSLYLLGGPDHTLKYSATSTLALIVGLLVFAALLWGQKRGRLAGTFWLKTLIIIIIIYGTITPFLGKLAIFNISSYLGRDETLTGRADGIWAVLMPYAMKQPLLGHGFGGFWTTSMREMTSSHAHNGYLDTILNVGFIGLFLFSLYMLSCISRAVRVLKDDFFWGALFVCYVFMTVVHNIAESSIYEFSGTLTAAILLFYFTSSAMGKEVGEHSQP
jgi:O-antigen ligase